MKIDVAKKQQLENLVVMPRIDLVLLSSIDDELQVLLKKRVGGQFDGVWGLPGGLINSHTHQNLDDTIKRVCLNLFQRQLPNLHQSFTEGSKRRDPRLEWSMTVVYVGWVRSDFFDQEVMDLQNLRWWNTSLIGPDAKLFLDHDQLINRALSIGVKHFRELIQELNFPSGLVANEFTMPELHEMCQVFTQSKIDLVTFRRRIEAAGCAVPLTGRFRPTIRRPAQLYKLADQGLSEFLSVRRNCSPTVSGKRISY